MSITIPKYKRANVNIPFNKYKVLSSYMDLVLTGDFKYMMRVSDFTWSAHRDKNDGCLFVLTIIGTIDHVVYTFTVPVDYKNLEKRHSLGLIRYIIEVISEWSMTASSTK